MSHSSARLPLCRRHGSSAIALALALAGGLVSCSGPAEPLVVSISPDGKAFYWEAHGKKLDPQAVGVPWDMQMDQWGEDGQPVHGRGTATINQPDHQYDVTAIFTFDEQGYKTIELTLSGGSLSETLTAQATRP